MYTYSSNTKIQGRSISLQVVWIDQEDGDDQLSNDIDELIESYNRRLAPTRVLFVCPLGVETRIQSLFDYLDESATGRLMSISHISVAPFDRAAKIVTPRVISILRPDGECDWEIPDTDIHGYAKAAVADLFDKTSTLLEAPHGYLFRKPSGQEDDYFVRTGNLLRDPTSLPVFSYLLLRELPQSCSTIYIDSFTILSFALGLKSLLRYFNICDTEISVPRIESIHSYEMTSEFRIPNERNYFILISASTSGGLADKLVKEKGAERTRITHLLGVAPESSELRKSSIYFRLRTRYAESYRKGVIEIGTEEFLVAQGSPRPVRISREHVNENAACKLGKKFYFHALKFYEPRRSYSRSMPNVHASGHGLNPQVGRSIFSVVVEPNQSLPSPIEAWVEKSLVHQIPASASMIIHMDDDLSAWVAHLLSKVLRGDLDVRPAKEMHTLDLPESIVVVAFQDEDLEGFGRANIVLRNKPSIHCHYVLCYAFPASDHGYRRLKADLRLGPRGSRRGWSDYLVLPVGDADLHESLILDGKKLSDEEIVPFRDILGDELAGALTARHGRAKTPAQELFLPRIDGQPLKLRPDSIFFTEEDSPVSQLAAYSMLSSAMQVARERDTKDGDDIGLAFDENPFVRAVLDPTMFVRFSDGVLQASLLRAARPAELDYSASSDLSGQFAATCLSVLYGYENEVGEAALEFVYALATKKVSLREADWGRLCKEIGSNPIMHAVYKLFA